MSSPLRQNTHTKQKNGQPSVSTQLLLRLILEFTLAAVIAYVITIPMIRLGLTEWLAVGLYAILISISGYLVLHRLTNRLEHINITLTRLNEDEPVTPLDETAHDVLHPMVSQLNRLVEERATLKAMRGQLYEQISEAAAQEERNRLARDLHDSIKQQVFSMSISASAAHAHLDNNDTQQARAALLDVRQSAQEAMVEMRALLQQLAPAPLEKSGLLDALREQAEAFSYRTGAKIATELGQLPDDSAFPIGAQEAVFRIAQEALSNIARHARANQVSLTLKQTDEQRLTLHITDDGQGFDTSQVTIGMGLNNIHSRAESLGGDVTLQSTPGAGTQLQIDLPLVSSDVSKIEGDIIMQEKYQTLLTTFNRVYGFWIGSVAALMITFPLLFNNPFTRNSQTDIIDVILLVAVVTALLGAIVVGVWSFLQTQTARNTFFITIPQNSPFYYRLKRYTYVGYAGIALVGLWFMPLLWVRSEALRFLSPLTALVFFVMLLVYYYQSYRAYDAELQSLPSQERHNAIKAAISQVHGAWFSVLLVVFIMLITDVFRNGFVLFPQVADEWMTTAMILITTLLFLNQIIQLWYYRRQLQNVDEVMQA